MANGLNPLRNIRNLGIVLGVHKHIPVVPRGNGSLASDESRANSDPTIPPVHGVMSWWLVRRAHETGPGYDCF